MRALRFRGSEEVSIREGAEEFADGAMGFEGMPADGIAAGDERKLMDGAIGAKNGPAGFANPAMDLRKPLATIEGLVVSTGGMTEASVDFVETHEIEIVGSREEKTAAGASDAEHFAEAGVHMGKMLDGLAGNDDVEGIAGKGKTLSIALNEGSRKRLSICCKFGAGGVERGGRKIAASDLSASAREMADETAASTGNFQNAKAGDGAEVFEDQLVPRSGGVFVSGIGVKDALMPGVVVSAQAHGLHVIFCQ